MDASQDYMPVEYRYRNFTSLSKTLATRCGWLLVALALPFANPAFAASFTEYPFTDTTGVAGGPANFTNGPDGNLWYVDLSGDSVGKIDSKGAVTQFELPGAPILGSSDTALEIATGTDGNLWFASLYANYSPTTGLGSIGRITPAGAITLFALPYGFYGAEAITHGPDASIWFLSVDSIGKVEPNGAFTRFPIPTFNPDPNIGAPFYGGIVADPNNNLWFAFTDYQQCNGTDVCQKITGIIGRMTPGGDVREFPLPEANASPYDMAIGPDGNIWFTQNTPTSTQTGGYQASEGKIGRVTPNGEITEFAIPTPNSKPFSITNGPDGNLWFTELRGNNIASITPAGSVTEYAIPTSDSGPLGIATGPQGNLWFYESYAGKLGKLAVATSSVNVDGYMSGDWYDPAQSGQGFQFEMTGNDNTMVAIWFTFAPDGSGPVWIYAQGKYDNTSNTVTLPAAISSGTSFPPNFDPNAVTTTPWGTMTFTFSDCNDGTANWNSTLPGYGSGGMPIRRITHINGMSCP